MSEDEDKLLDDIGRFVRRQEAEERRRFDERWRRLAEGTISAAEDAELRALAEESEEARLDYEALQPFGLELHDRLAREWQARTPAVEPGAPARPIGEGRWRRASPYRWLAVAATLVLAVLGWRLWRGPELPPLPGYVAELSGDVKETRSPEDTSGTSVFVPGSPFRLLLRPERSIEEILERRFYFESPRGELHKVGYTMSTEGAIEIVGTVGQDFLLEPGAWTLIFVYGRPGRLPDPEELTAAKAADDWRVVRVLFEVVGSRSSVDSRFEVELAGCRSFYADRGCVPGEELTLWVRAPQNSRLEVRVGERRLDDPGVAVDGGRRFTFAASARDRELEVRAATLEGEETWRVELVDQELPAWLVAGRELYEAGELAAARDQLIDRTAKAEPLPAALAHGILARSLRALGAPDEEVLAHLEEAIELHQQTGALIHLARDFGMATYLDLRHQRLAGALDRVAEVASVLPPDAPAQARFCLVYYQVVLARKLGDFRRALELAQDGLALPRRLGLAEEQAQAEEEMALVLQDVGRFAEADQLLRRLETAYEGQPCRRARVLNNHAWVLIRAADPELGDPLPLHAQALEIIEREGCDAKRALDVLLDQARVFVERGMTWEGLQALERVQALAEHATPLQRLWWEQVEGLLALREGRAFDALESFERLENLAAGSLFNEGQWLAKLGQAKAHRLLDDPPAALAALEAAEALLDEHSLQVPLHAGRGRFMAEREEGASLHLETLLAQGREAEALKVARRSRSRLLRDLRQSHRLAQLSTEEQTAWNRAIESYLRLRTELEEAAVDDWRLSTERLEQALEGRAGLREEALGALDRAFAVLERGRRDDQPPLPVGEAVLVYHPLSQGRDWVGFGAFSGIVKSHRFELPDEVSTDSAELARRLLEPFEEILAAAPKVRILPYGRLNELDFHALPWGGDVLLAGRPVVYGLDLVATTPPVASRRALVVADPRGDLPAAGEEGEAVATTLGSVAPKDWDVIQLTRTDATLARLRKLVVGVDLLHYAGHGAFAGWDSALLLADESRLTLGDVLTLDRPPAQVVLSSCEAARTAEDGGALSLGLAQAFLVAGSERVLAAMRPVGDRATAEFFRELYGFRSSMALSEALRRAQLSWRQRDPSADWASFRLLEP